ncbi:MAG: lysophospholipid acyltransferase family protein [Butyribacter sp.]|nr:lysophospholipid acyltransferase family protein [bacterium]MDY3854540.1 lysophospholipid acyltransferase family protein [Butyribacter sp.]
MRLLLVAIYLILYTIISIPLYLVMFIIGKINPQKRAVIAQKIVNTIGFRPILFLSGVKLTVKGRENILQDQAALYVFNHKGFFDILAGYTTAPYPTAYVSKKEIGKVPMVSRWMKFMNCLFLDRDNIRQGLQTILQGVELLKNGTSVYIAPEGTRNPGDELLEFHEASFKLAEKSKCPIVPVAINNTDAVFEQHLPWIRKAHVIIEYCEPIYMDEMERSEKKQIGQTVRSILQERINQNKAEL